MAVIGFVMTTIRAVGYIETTEDVGTLIIWNFMNLAPKIIWIAASDPLKNFVRDGFKTH